jgi:glycine cleavage system H protein
MNFPSDRLYSEYHLWVKMEKDQAFVGITDYAKEELGDVDYIELPELDETVLKDKPIGIFETSKAVTDIIAPLSGIVVEKNVALLESPEILSDDPYGDGWLIILEPSNPEELDELMNAADYAKLVTGEAEE